VNLLFTQFLERRGLARRPDPQLQVQKFEETDEFSYTDILYCSVLYLSYGGSAHAEYFSQIGLGYLAALSRLSDLFTNLEQHE
jgi:hypothetical protein